MTEVKIVGFSEEDNEKKLCLRGGEQQHKQSCPSDVSEMRHICTAFIIIDIIADLPNFALSCKKHTRREYRNTILDTPEDGSFRHKALRGRVGRCMG
jgi:hypothetical protein